MNTSIDYRETVKSVTEYTLELAREILADPETLPSSREYAEFLLTLPVRVDSNGAGHTAGPERESSNGGTRSTSTKPSNPGELIGATEKQINALINMGSKKLIGDATIRHLTADIRVQDIVDRAAAGTIVTKGEASKALDFLFPAPWKPREAAPKTSSTPKAVQPERITEDGMYKLGDRIIKVQKAVHGSGNLYAKELIASEYEDDEGETQFTWSFEYAPGLINKLTAADKLSLEEAKKFGKLYEWCCVCGTQLTDEKSISLGIGPICAKKF